MLKDKFRFHENCPKIFSLVLPFKFAGVKYEMLLVPGRKGKEISNVANFLFCYMFSCRCLKPGSTKKKIVTKY